MNSIEGPTHYKLCFLVGCSIFFAEHDLILLNNFDKNICIELIHDSLLYLFTYALLICVLLKNESI